MVTRVSETGTLTTIALVIIAIVAVITVIGILWGARLKAQRRAADRNEQARLEAEGDRTTHDAGDTPARSETPPPPPAPATPAPLADEPIAAAPPLSAAPATEAASAPEPGPAPAPAPPPPPAPAGPPLADAPVTLLKGLGPKVAARLAEHGITTVGDLAALDATRAESLDARLGPFTGRMNRDRWIEQARFLAAGDRAGFEAVFGKL